MVRWAWMVRRVYCRPRHRDGQRALAAGPPTGAHASSKDTGERSNDVEGQREQSCLIQNQKRICEPPIRPRKRKKPPGFSQIPGIYSTLFCAVALPRVREVSGIAQKRVELLQTLQPVLSLHGLRALGVISHQLFKHHGSGFLVSGLLK